MAKVASVAEVCKLIITLLSGVEDGDEEACARATDMVEKCLQTNITFDHNAVTSALLLETLINFGYDPALTEFKYVLQSASSLRNELEGVAAATTVYDAAYNGDFEAVKDFVMSYPSFRDKSGGIKGQSLLYIAARYGHIELVKWLVEDAHCDVNVQNRSEGSTACHGATWAAAQDPSVTARCKVIGDFLLQHGANMTASNDFNEVPSNTAVGPMLESFLPKELATLPWQYQHEDFSWEEFSEKEQVIIEAAFASKQDLVRYVERHLYEIDFKEFSRSGRGGDAVFAVSIRKIALPPADMQVVWQFQHERSWHKLDDSKVTNAVRNKNAHVEVGLRGISRKATVDLKAFTWADTTIGKSGSIRWILHRTAPAPEVSQSSELDHDEGEYEVVLGGNIDKVPKRDPPPAANITTAAENILQIPKNIISKVYKRRGASADVIAALTILGAPLEAAAAQEQDLVVYGTSAQLEVLDKILLQDLSKIKDEEPPPPPEPVVVIESGEFPVPYTAEVQRFLLCRVNVMEEALTKADSTAATISTKLKGNDLFISVKGSVKQCYAGASMACSLRGIINLRNMELAKFQKIEKDRRAKLRTNVLRVPYTNNTKTDWYECGREISSRGETRLTEFAAAYEKHLAGLLDKQLLVAEPFTKEWCDPIKGSANAFADKDNWDQRLGQIALDSLKGILKAKEKAAKEGQTKGAQKASAALADLLDMLTRQFTLTTSWDVLPVIMWRAMLVINSFKLSVPLFAEATALLRTIDQCKVVSLSTGTGSGKSTVLPVLLVAIGFKRVLVTQPRRLPCQLLSSRLSSVYGPGVVGWQVAGASENPHNPILYLTDGLYKEWLLGGTPVSCDAVILDEIHEKGVNMDLCVALLAKKLVTNPTTPPPASPPMKGSKRPPIPLQKVILSSATLDPCMLKPFRSLAASFNLPVPSPFGVTVIKRAGENAIALACELFKKKLREEQILCFLPSQAEVREAVMLFNEKTGAEAFPLFAQQNPSTQQQYLRVGAVFFSTNIAETSLTFPCLRFVIDSGQINAPFFSYDKAAMELKTIPAPRSALTQRKGRLGRTAPGEYYQLYKDESIDSDYSSAQLQTVDLTEIEFNLVRSTLPCSLLDLMAYFPSSPSVNSVNFARQALTGMGILDTAGRITKMGSTISEMPIVGGVRMARFVLSALQDFGCGSNALRLSALLSACGNSADQLLRAAPARFVSDQGDFQTLLHIFNEAHRFRLKSKTPKFDAHAFCRSVGINFGSHILSRAMAQYEQLNQSFMQKQKFWYLRSQEIVTDWKPVALALLTAYGDQTFGSAVDYYGRKHQYVRLWSSNAIQCYATLSGASKVAKKFSEDPIRHIVALGVFYSPQSPNTAMLSVAGSIDLSWLSNSKFTTKRQIKLSASELQTASSLTVPSYLDSSTNGNVLTLSGPIGLAVEMELQVYENLKVSKSLDLSTLCNATKDEDNLKICMKQVHIFHPLIWRNQNTKQLEVTITTSTKTVKAEGRDADAEALLAGFKTFMGWMKNCLVLRSAESEVPPRALKSRDAEIETRIARVTDPLRTKVDLWEQVKGPKATRTTRMEAFCWVAVCLFDCRIEGGFVRDWICGGFTQEPPKGTPWLDTSGSFPVVDKGFIPNDLDLQLPSYKQFDIDRFLKELANIGIVVLPDCIKDDGWRYLLLVDRDEPTGPFSVDLIEPHVVLTHDMVDFDVSNLYCIKNFTREIGMRVDVTVAPANLTLDTIVSNISYKQFIRMRPLDHNMETRIQKMKDRGWRQADEMIFTPNKGPRFGATLLMVPKSDPAYRIIESKMASSLKAKVLSIQIINTHNLYKIYEAMKAQIEQENHNNANEKLLFHGTSSSSVQGIADVGFDDRFWNFGGRFGCGAYFAEDPRKSHSYTDNTPVRSMLWVKVLLGKQEVRTKYADGEGITSPEHGFHSIFGNVPNEHKEYIVYRYGQALPYMHIVYQV